MVVYLEYFFYLILIEIVLFYIGHVFIQIIGVKTDKPFLNLFIKLTMGLFILVVIYSLIRTGGKSIHLVFIPLVLFVWITNGFKNLNFKLQFSIPKNSIKPIVYLILLNIIIFGWKAFYVYAHNGEFAMVLNMDDLCHVNRAMFFNEFGIETTDLNYIQLPDGVQPFHYFEAWSVATIQFFTNLNYWLSEQLILYPIFSGIIVSGIWSIAERFSLKKITYIISIGILFTSGFMIFELRNIQFFKWASAIKLNAIDEFWALKLSVVYIILLASILLYIYNLKRLSILTLLTLPIISITLGPAILSTVFILFAFGALFKRSNLRLITRKRDLFAPILIGAFILLFYAVFKASSDFISVPGASGIFDELNTIAKLKHKFIISVEKIVQLAILYSPFIVIGLIVIKKLKNHSDYKDLMVSVKILLIIIIVALPMWSLFYSVFGSNEFFNYPSVPILNIVSFIFLILLVNLVNLKWQKITLGLFVVVSFGFFSYRSYHTLGRMQSTNGSNLYSPEYLKRVNVIINRLENKNGCKIENPNDSPFSDAHDCYGFHLVSMHNEPYSLISISRYKSANEITTLEKEETRFLHTIPFNRYVEIQKKNGEFISLNHSQERFIKEQKIEFIIVSPKESIPTSLHPFIKEQILDSKTNETFVLLDKSKF